MSARTPPEKEIAFREHYLRTGNVKASARQAGVNENTGYHLARYANADPEFVEARREMWMRSLPDVERMLMTGLQIALDRLEQGPIKLSELADAGAAKVSVQDPCPQYLKAIVDGFKALTLNRKIDVDHAKPAETGGVVINVFGPEGVEVEGDGAGDSASAQSPAT